MNVSCPQCKTVFRVDPRKVPADGVRARCSVCGGVFEVTPERPAAAPRGGAAAAAPRSPAEVETPSPTVPPEETAESAARAEPQAAPAEPAPPSPGARGVEPPPEPPPPSPEPTAPEPTPAPAAEPAGAPPRPGGQPFGGADPDARARRLARALISDVAAYNPERQETGLREGRLKEMFQEELKKSWQEYVDQVGLDMARSTPYFRDALNEILARGTKVF